MNTVGIDVLKGKSMIGANCLFPKDSMIKMLIKQAIEQLKTVSVSVERLRTEMDCLAAH